MIILFYIAAAVAVISTLMVIIVKNAVHSLLFLIVSLLSAAVIFYLMGAPFMAALEVIIYAGAIMVLFIFVIMMLNLGKESEELERKLLYPGIWIGPSILAAILLAEMIYLFFTSSWSAVNLKFTDARQVGIALYGPYLLGVELAGFLLLSGIVGAYHLGYKKRKFYHRFLQGDVKE